MTFAFTPTREFFVGIDSDGCVFDTMEVKHKECFIPNIVQYFHLAAVSKYVRECAEFLNLYSKWRGTNRFPGVVMTVDLLANRPEVVRRGVALPKLESTRRWLETETRLGNPALADAVAKSNDPELANLLEWSKAVNEAVERIVHRVPPFQYVRECLAKLANDADQIVCSATPTEALTREWEEHELSGMVGAICGQEVGSKKEILAAAKQYKPGRAIMLGDAPGDLAAARANGVLFFPIIAGAEDESWRRFRDEALPRFLDGSYTGAYEAELEREFNASLPATPPWKTLG